MRGVPLLLVVLLIGWSGCLGDGDEPASLDPLVDDSARPLAFLPSTNVTACDPECFEPAVAVDQQGRIYAIGSSGRMEGVAVSTDGGLTFTMKPWPDMPNPLPVVSDEQGSAGDDVVQVAPWGTVYMTRLYSDTGGIAGGGVQLVASEDGGGTWSKVG